VVAVSDGQTVLIGNDGGFGLPDARRFERDDGTEGEIPPDEVFLPPLRTAANGWAKWHAARDCGRKTVLYIESTSPQRTTDRYDWELYCADCGHHIRWDEVLYVSEAWYEDRRPASQEYDYYWRMFDDLRFAPETVLSLGPDPMEAVLKDAIDEAWRRHHERRKAHAERLSELSETDD
jgi:hypothetical protein